jgi:hypothetical protein
MTIRTKIFVALALIVAVGLGVDLFLGLASKSYGTPVIAARMLFIGIALYYAVSRITNKKPKS